MKKNDIDFISKSLLREIWFKDGTNYTKIDDFWYEHLGPNYVYSKYQKELDALFREREQEEFEQDKYA